VLIVFNRIRIRLATFETQGLEEKLTFGNTFQESGVVPGCEDQVLDGFPAGAFCTGRVKSLGLQRGKGTEPGARGTRTTLEQPES